MRVLYLNDMGQLSGAERSLLTLLRELPAGVPPAVAYPRGLLFHAIDELGVVACLLRGTDASLKLHPVHTSKAVIKLVLSGWELRSLARRLETDPAPLRTRSAPASSP
jgi:hypothetical protein